MFSTPRPQKIVPLWDVEKYKARQATNDSMACAVHIRPTYLECPVVLCMVGETSYGIWVGFVKSDIVFTIILINYLFIYL
jgi:hypothetical protein